jgi:hypothetical protein
VTLRERLAELVRTSVQGTLIPVEGLAALLDEYDRPPVEQRATPGLSPAEVAERFATTVNGKRRVPSAAAVRKWVREGMHGVRLEAYRCGPGWRITEQALQNFLLALQEKAHGTSEDTPYHEFPSDDVADEIAASEAKHTERRRRRAG